MLWEERSPIWRRRTSPAYQANQQRFLPLLALDVVSREAEFDELQDLFGWSMASAANYWAQMGKAAEQLGMAPSPEAKEKQRILNYLKKEEDPRRPTKAMSVEQMEQIAALLEAKGAPAALAMRLAFILGQRIGDTAQLERTCLSKIYDPHSKQHFTVVLFKRGKTTRRRQPFSLHLPDHLQLSVMLWSLAESHDGARLFPQDLHEILRQAIQEVDPELGLLSIRRGGLQHMTQLGASTSCLLHHSRHATIEMLERYFEWGKWSLMACRERCGLDEAWRLNIEHNPIEPAVEVVA